MLILPPQTAHIFSVLPKLSSTYLSCAREYPRRFWSETYPNTTRRATNRSPQSQLKLYDARRRRKWPQEVAGSAAPPRRSSKWQSRCKSSRSTRTASDAGRRPKYPGKAEERNIGAIRIIHPSVHPWNNMRMGA